MTGNEHDRDARRLRERAESPGSASDAEKREAKRRIPDAERQPSRVVVLTPRPNQRPARPKPTDDDPGPSAA